MNAKLEAVNDAMVGGLTIAERRIRDSGDYINRRISNLKAGEAWLDVGRELAELKAFLLKQHKGDNTAAGWYAAFSAHSTPFSFRRSYADRLIAAHDCIVGTTGTYKKNLPTSARALFELAKIPVPYMEQTLAKCSPWTTSADVRRLAKAAGYVPAPKQRQNRDPMEDAHNRHIALVRKLPAEAARQEALAFLADLGISPMELV